MRRDGVLPASQHTVCLLANLFTARCAVCVNSRGRTFIRFAALTIMLGHLATASLRAESATARLDAKVVDRYSVRPPKTSQLAENRACSSSMLPSSREQRQS